MTRAFLSAVKLDFVKAAVYHPLFFTVPIIVLYFLFDGNLFGKKVDRIVIITTMTAFVAVWFLRLIGVLPCL